MRIVAPGSATVITTKDDIKNDHRLVDGELRRTDTIKIRRKAKSKLCKSILTTSLGDAIFYYVYQ